MQAQTGSTGKALSRKTWRYMRVRAFSATSRLLYPREIDPAVFTVNRTCPVCRPNTFCGTNKKGKIHRNITGLVKFDLHYVLSLAFGACRHCDVYCSVRSLEHQLSGFHSRSGAHPSPIRWVPVFFPRRREVKSLSSAEVNSEWSYTSPPPIRVSGMDSDSFTFSRCVVSIARRTSRACVCDSVTRRL
jgi:hypothetical protein